MIKPCHEGSLISRHRRFYTDHSTPQEYMYNKVSSVHFLRMEIITVYITVYNT